MRCRCPVCLTPLTATDILFAPYPPHLRCAQCRTRLVGDRFVRRQLWVVMVVAIVGGSLFAVGLRANLLSLLGGCLCLIGLSLCVGLLMTLLTLRYGRYIVQG
jgi:hypothetical protein